MMYANYLMPIVTRQTNILLSLHCNDINTIDLVNLASSMQAILKSDITDHVLIIYISTNYSNVEKEIIVLKRVSIARNRK